jgi:isoleucyl-tRNA synthetase
MAEEKKNIYKDSINLPKTDFAMKADLVVREPAMRKQWAKDDIYAKIRKLRSNAPMYILHDGPPYANGDIHMGHVINKVLKDMVVKYKTMQGFDAPYIPGWDCHGLPIEAKVMTELGDNALSMPKPEIRQKCKKYASNFVKIQSKQFQSLGVFGDFENPYLTFKPQYEAGILEVFAELVGKNLVYKQLRPIHWSIGCQTALAEAELEYHDIPSPSIYVNFPLCSDSVEKLIQLGIVDKKDIESAKICLMIWTTTPWTLAANLAVAVNPALEYTAVSYQCNGCKFISIVAKERLEAIAAAGKIQLADYKAAGKTVTGSLLEGLRYCHPFVDKNPTDKDAYKVILANYVTTEDGTGLVHIAPGHGIEDYMSGRKYGLAVYSPVNDDGCYDDTVPAWLTGKNVLEVEDIVNSKLSELGAIFAKGTLVHSYPHCWRSKMPVIFRATEQWFISVDRELPATGKSLRNMALESAKLVKWIPDWGQKRIEGMLESRPDWCISRQRSWGLPIPVFLNSDGKALLTKESVLAVSKHIGQKGSDCWFTDSPKEILGQDFILPEGFRWDDLKKEENIFDVWFESGCSWYSVAKKAGWPIPVDLYLEGSDQHRGWFQLSMLPALGAVEKPPFKAVLTHGFTVDEKGVKQSKSLGNYVNAQDEISKYGADILRLWVASVNYQEDMRCNDELIGRTQDSYRKIRNTLRYLMGNITDFDPHKDAVAYDKMYEIDKWAMQQLQKLIAEVTSNYEEFAFHRVYSLLYNFCTVEMSSIYMDVMKDRMYCDGANSLSRRSGQTAMYKILDCLVRILAPIMVHTAEEAWAAMGSSLVARGSSLEQSNTQYEESVHLAKMPVVDESIDWKKDAARWEKIMQVRNDCLLVLEGLRQNKEITSNQQASVTIECANDEEFALLEKFGAEKIAALCIVSEVKFIAGSPPQAGKRTVTAQKSSHQKCQRCWNYGPTVGKNEKYPDLCSRCADVVTKIKN